jgi:CubicO group peptidase (beta-lactamase class C family)
VTAPDRPAHPLDQVGSWDGPAAAGYLDGSETHVVGPAERVFPWASVTKLVTALATWIAVEEGTVGWDDAAGPAGSTLRHLLAHASGLAPDEDRVLAPPGRSRIYSNHGFLVAGRYVGSAAGIPFEVYVDEAVLGPLGMSATTFGHPGSGAAGSLDDLLRLARELRTPTLVSAETWSEVTSPAFPGLRGVLPGFGRQPDNAWGVGVEIRDHKQPHWTGRLNSPRTFGHFGRSGSFLWVDPVAGLAAGALAERPFGPWATEAWPALSDSILESAAGAPD